MPVSLLQKTVAGQRRTGEDKDTSGPPRRDSALANYGVCLAVTVIGVTYVAHFAFRQWLPWDDGMLGQAAERLLSGQLPHRDFDDVYSGGLTWLHAQAFRVGGVNLVTLRATLLTFFAVSIPLWFWIARQFVRPYAAALVTFCCIAWSVPNYPASMPSWYNLILSMAAVAAMLRYDSTRRGRWLVIAGATAGLSIVIKVVGIYLLAALYTYVAYDQAQTDGASNVRRDTAVFVVIVLGSGLAILAAAPILLVRSHATLGVFLDVAIPPAATTSAIGFALITRWREGWRPTPAALVPFAALTVGALLPLAACIWPYWVSHAIPALLRGTITLPMRRARLGTTRTPGADPLWLVFGLPLTAALMFGRTAAVRRRTAFVAMTASVAWISLVMKNTEAASLVWLSARMLLPCLCFASVGFAQGRARRGCMGDWKVRRAVLLLLTASWCALVQFPYATPVYFAYVAPLVVLAAVAIGESTNRPPRSVRAIVLAVYTVFAIFYRKHVYPGSTGESPPLTKLAMPRGGIEIDSSEAVTYTRVVELLRQHAGSQYILATPDAPEIYFLSGLPNPTRTFYEILDGSARVNALATLDQFDIRAVVINRRPVFSPSVSGPELEGIARRFTSSERVGRFDVRWRE